MVTGELPSRAARGLQGWRARRRMVEIGADPPPGAMTTTTQPLPEGRESLIQSPVNVTMHESVALIAIDDGKANVLDLDVTERFNQALVQAEQDARAVVIAGRPGYLSAGLDMNVVLASDDTTTELLRRAIEMVLRLNEYTRPVVAACTGHAVAAGAALLLCSDMRIGALGDYKIGFIEVSRGLPMSELAVELARARLSHRYVRLACNAAQTYSPDQAVDVGFLDATAPPEEVIDRAVTAATDMADRLDPEAFASTRRAMCRALSEVIVHTSADLVQVTRDFRRGYKAGGVPSEKPSG